MRDKLRSCWQNCGALDDKRLLGDEEVLGIDAMEDSIGPLGDNTVRIRGLITRFESCYHIRRMQTATWAYLAGRES